ncbi:MAG: hypothetical protein Fur0032_11040 [Terrimicrobiaceae bacterium]
MQSSPVRRCPCLLRSLAALAALAALATPALAQISNVSVIPATPNRYARTEIRYNLALSYTNPDDINDIQSWVRITHPDGTQKNYPAFFFQNYTVNTTTQKIVASGAPHWRIRFAPPVTGSYTYRVFAVKSGVTYQSANATFSVVGPAATAKGFVEVNPAHPARLRYSRTGESFFPVGPNLWEIVFGFNDSSPSHKRYTGGFTDAEAYLLYTRIHEKVDHLIAAGATAVRFRADSHYMSIELNENPPDWVIAGYPDGVPGFKPGQYNAKMAFIIDTVVNKLAANNIAIQWCTWNMNSGSKLNPNTNKQEPIRKHYLSYMRDDSWNEALTKRRLRYQVARWGWCPSLYAWEYFNETSAAEGVDLATQRWTNITSWLDALDQNHPARLITNSRDGIDTYEEHKYALNWHQVGHLADPSAPYQWSEYGCPDGQLQFMNAHDARMGAWGAFVNNRSAALYWWIEHQVGYGTAGYAYSGLKAFLAGENLARPATEGTFTKVHAGTNDLDGKDCLILGGDRGYAWLVRTPSQESADRSALSGLIYDVSGFANGTYSIQWWDPVAGTILSTASHTTSNGKVRLTVPAGVTRDIAAKLIRQ